MVNETTTPRPVTTPASTTSLPGFVTLNHRLERFAIWTLGIYLVIKMFYIFSGGSAQPADVLFAGILIIAVSPKNVVAFLKYEVALIVMLIWVTIVNFAWFFQLGKFDFLFSTVYLYFNTFIAILSCSAYLGNRKLFDRLIPWFIYISVGLQVFAVLIHSSGGRSIGTFRNPNQLAYWALCATTILLIIRRNRIYWPDLFIIMGAMFCSIASVSRGGLTGGAALLALWLWFALKTPLYRLLGGLTGAAILLLGFVLMPASEVQRWDSVSAYEQREARQAETSQIELRNIDRIFDYYQYTILGAGEGSYRRFEDTTTQYALEIHSSFVNMLFSYGIIGFCSFVAMLITIFIRTPVGYSLYLVPILTYGLSHNGMRFSFFWIVIGLLIAIGIETTAERRSAKLAPCSLEPRSNGRRRHEASL